MKQARDNDLRAEKGEPPREALDNEKVLVWPDLVYVEFICLILSMALMIVWSLFLKAPLEEPANPTISPQPVEGAVVLPRPAGDAGVLRSVAGRRGTADADHRRPGGHPLHGHSTPAATASTASGRA